MRSTKCAQCGMVNWASAETCKRCGVHFNLANETLFAQTAYATAYQTAPYQNSPYAYAQYPQMKKNAGLAVASLIVGIISFLTLSFVGIGAITGIVLGIAALSKIRKNPEQYGGQGMAIAGLITSALSIMIAVPLAIILAVAIPNLLASRRAANEASAINILRTIAASEATYQATSGNGEYGTLRELANAQLIDVRMARGTKNGYRFMVRVRPTLTPDEPASYEAVAMPISYQRSGLRSFYIDETGVIRFADKRGAEADANDTPLDADWGRETGARTQSSQDDF